MRALYRYGSKTGEIIAMANRPSYDPNITTKSGEEAFKILRLPIYMNQVLHSNYHCTCNSLSKWKLDTVLYNDRGLRCQWTYH